MKREKIVESYRAFVKKIRDVYPESHIICALGCMDATKQGSPWPDYIKEATDPLNDKNIYNLLFPFMNKPGHPREEDHEKMAKRLIAFIEKNIGW